MTISEPPTASPRMQEAFDPAPRRPMPDSDNQRGYWASPA